MLVSTPLALLAFASTALAQLQLQKGTAVIIADPVNALVMGIRNTTAGQDVIGALQRLEQAAQSSEAFLLYTTVGFSPGAPDLSPFSPAGITRNVSNWPIPPGPFNSLIQELQPRAQDPLIIRQRGSVTVGTSVDLILRSQNISNVVIGGITTTGVVLSSVYSLHDLGYNVTVARSATFQPGDTNGTVSSVVFNSICPVLSVNVVDV